MTGILLCDCAFVNMQPADQYNTCRTHFVFLLQITVFFKVHMSVVCSFVPLLQPSLSFLEFATHVLVLFMVS